MESNMRRLILLGGGSAALLAIGLMLAGCGEQQENPAGPSDADADQLGLGTSMRTAIGTQSVSASGATATSIPFAPQPVPNQRGGSCSGNCAFLDQPIGFSFRFFDNTYTTFSLSGNGFIQFGPNPSHGCCDGRQIPSADGINNLIAAAWTDLDERTGGMLWGTLGTAPNRLLVVQYSDVPWCCDMGVNRVTTQIVLYETSNVIEIHTANQPAGHIYTQGIEDAIGTRASFLPGRVASDYGLTNDAVRFTTPPSWVPRAAPPSARRGLAAAGANGILYAIAGTNSAGAALRTVQAYDPSTNAWSTKAPLPAPRQLGSGATTILGTIYVAGGQDDAKVLTRTLYAYRATTNTWSIKARMPAPGGCGGSATIGGKLYVFSGCVPTSTGGQTASGLLHRYDPATDTWATLPSAPTVHFQPVVGAAGGKLYVAGGNDGAGVQTTRLDVFDPATNSWSAKSSMPNARIAAAGGVIGGKLYVVGGRNGTSYLNSVDVYDPVTNRWFSRGPMPTARAALAVAAVNNLLYAIDGRNASTSLSLNERFTP
jgi:N-acetylneuraminic acid mutarotase